MNIRFRLCATITLLAVAFATSIPGQAFAQEKKASGKSCIWKISDTGSTVYLAGSVHLLRKIDMPIPSAYARVYEDSDEVIFEVDMATMSDPSMLLKLQKLGSLPEGETLGDHLSEKTMTALRAYLGASGIPAMLMEKLKPGMLLITISSLEAMKLGASPELGLETTFYKRCVEDGKPSSGLETLEYQLSRFDELTDEEVDKELAEGLEKIGEAAEVLGGLIAAWKVGDVEKMNEILTEQMVEDSPIQKLLLTDRNKNWIPAIEKALAGKKNTMFLVGAAHLVGEDSVVDILQKKGLKVEQLSATGN